MGLQRVGHNLVTQKKKKDNKKPLFSPKVGEPSFHFGQSVKTATGKLVGSKPVGLL